MIYLTATDASNGCLRVIPGSHRRQHSLHDATVARSGTLSGADNPADPLYQSVADQVAVAVTPGDVVTGDAALPQNWNRASDPEQLR